MPIPESELTWTYARAGGPGGQNVNKVSSKAVLRWNMKASDAVPPHVKARIASLFPARVTLGGAVVIASQEHRDQERNRDACREKLAAMVKEAAKLPKPRLKVKPSRAAKQKRLNEKKRESQRRKLRRVDED